MPSSSVPVANLTVEQIYEMYEHACELRNALHGYESLYADPTVRETINKFDEFLSANKLID